MATSKLVKQQFIISVILINFLLSNCTSVQPVDYSVENLRSELRVDDRVEITTKNGEEHSFTIVGLPEAGIVGENITVPYEEIADIEATRLSETGEVVTIIGGAVLLGAYVWYYVIYPIVAIVSLASWGS